MGGLSLRESVWLINVGNSSCYGLSFSVSSLKEKCEKCIA